MQEQFIYSLMASGLGILIVFTILVLLSLLMIVIRKLSDSEPKKKKISTKPASKAINSPDLPLPVLVAAASEGFGGGAGSPNWIAAAVGAFFALEDDSSAAPTASVWAADKYNQYDPWVANNKLSKTVPGV